MKEDTQTVRAGEAGNLPATQNSGEITARRNLRPWRKGQSGNSGGRPRTAHLSAAYRQQLEQPFPRDRAGRTYAEVIAQHLANEAARGDTKAARELADRTDGKARQSVEVSTTNPNLSNLSHEKIVRELVEMLPDILADFSEETFNQVIEQARAARLVLEEERREAVSGVGFGESLEGGDD